MRDYRGRHFLRVGVNGSNAHLRSIRMPRVFISFCSSDWAQVELLRLHKTKGRIEFVDYSIKEPYDRNWTQSASYRIRTSDVAIFFAGEESKRSKGMFLENYLCNKYRTPKVIVPKNDYCRIPDYLMTGRYVITDWNVNHISRCINYYGRKRRYWNRDVNRFKQLNNCTLLMRGFRVMGRKALVVGINNYGPNSLNGCINDAKDVANILSRNYDGSVNFDVILQTDLDFKNLMKYCSELFESDPEVALLYFSGHGYSSGDGGYLVTTDYDDYVPGVNVDEILKMAINSKAKNKIIIIDACFSGKMGENPFNTYISNLSDGMTIMTSSKKDEPSMEFNGHGLFTSLLLEAMAGGASDLLGNITAGGVYSYIDRCLGPWNQRPVFKTNISSFVSIRMSKPLVELEQLKEMVEYFDKPDTEYQLDPSYEFTNDPNMEHEIKQPYSQEEHVRIFKTLQKYASLGLVKPVGEEHMYFAAMNSKSCILTTNGKYYHKLIREGRL